MRPALLLAALLLSAHAPAAELEIAARLDLPPANLAITHDGRKFVSLHQFFEPVDRMAEITGENTIRTFAVDGLDSVLALHATDNGILWMLDNGLRSKVPPKLIAWDYTSRKVACTVDLPPPATLPTSFLANMAFDLEHQAIYIADPASGSDAALIVVDLKTLSSRRVLRGAPCVIPEDLDIMVGGKPIETRKADGTMEKLRTGVMALAINSSGDWLYFGPMNGTTLYRVRTSDLLDKFVEPAALAAAVERYSDKPACSGIAIDSSDQIFVTDLSANGLGMIGLDRKYQLLASDPKLRWPSCVTISPEGVVYVVASQLQASHVFNSNNDQPEKPFLIFCMAHPPSVPAATPTESPSSAPTLPSPDQ